MTIGGVRRTDCDPYQNRRGVRRDRVFPNL
jgi:hypothetical protein